MTTALYIIATLAGLFFAAVFVGRFISFGMGNPADVGDPHE